MIGKATAAIIDDSETYFEINKTITKIPIEINAAIGCTARIMPNKVAIPLPPLNEANKGKICPTN